MKKLFVDSLSLLSLVTIVAITSYAQGNGSAQAVPASVKETAPAVVITATTAPIDLARAALAAQGGEKFKSVKSMVLRGSVDLYPPNSTQPLPGGFLIVTAGDKVRLEVETRSPVSF